MAEPTNGTPGKWYDRKIVCPHCKTIYSPIESLEKCMPFVLVFNVCCVLCTKCGNAQRIDIEFVRPSLIALGD